MRTFCFSTFFWKIGLELIITVIFGWCLPSLNTPSIRVCHRCSMTVDNRVLLCQIKKYHHIKGEFDWISYTTRGSCKTSIVIDWLSYVNQYLWKNLTQHAKYEKTSFTINNVEEGSQQSIEKFECRNCVLTISAIFPANPAPEELGVVSPHPNTRVGNVWGVDLWRRCVWDATLSRTQQQKARLMAHGRSGHMGRFLNLERGRSESRRDQIWQIFWDKFTNILSLGDKYSGLNWQIFKVDLQIFSIKGYF